MHLRRSLSAEALLPIQTSNFLKLTTEDAQEVVDDVVEVQQKCFMGTQILVDCLSTTSSDISESPTTDVSPTSLSSTSQDQEDCRSKPPNTLADHVEDDHVAVKQQNAYQGQLPVPIPNIPDIPISASFSTSTLLDIAEDQVRHDSASEHYCLYCKDISQCPLQPAKRNFSSTPAYKVINKVWPSAEEAISDMKSDSTVLAGGFGLCGVPDTLINSVVKNPSITGLTAVSNNAGVDGAGLGLLLASKQIKKMIASYVGENKTFERMYLAGDIELELTPQGTLAERCRAGGAGIPAFYTPAAFGTVVQTGELPLRHNTDGSVAEYGRPRDVKVFDGKSYVMEESIKADYAFVKAWKADKLGNCQFRFAAWNFNAAMGKNAKCTIVEAEHIVEPGEIDPAAVHLPGIYVKRVVQSTSPKGIEKRVYAKEETDMSALGKGETANKRERIVRRAAKEFKHGMYANLGIGMPMLAPSFVDPSIEVQLQSENGILGLGNFPKKGQEDPDLINAGKETVTLRPGAACFGSEDSFGMIRSGRIDLTILGAMQVSAKGDLANWMLPGKIKGFGGAMDLVSNPAKTKVVVTMEHTDKHGRPKILKQCEFPLTGKACVSRIITELAVFDVDFTNGLTLVEVADGVTVDEVKAKTEAPFIVSDDLKPMQI